MGGVKTTKWLMLDASDPTGATWALGEQGVDPRAICIL